MEMIYSQKLKNAIKFAIKTHDLYQKQMRKGKDVAYITHPLTVGVILASAGCSEDVVAAGILHDTIEDSTIEKKVTASMLAQRFGDNVAELVSSVSENDKAKSWDDRKNEAVEHIKDFSQESLLVKSADIVSNVSELVDDYARYGEDVFSRFNAPREKVISNQLRVIDAILRRWVENPLAGDLQDLAEKIGKIQVLG